MRQRLCLAFFLFSLLLFNGCARVMLTGTVYQGPFLVPAEEQIPGVPDEVTYSDFWIRKIPNPDDIIMTSQEIDTFNRDNPARSAFIVDITGMPDQCEGASIRRYLADNARYLESAQFFITGSIPLEKAERQRIIALMDTARVPDTISLKFGLILHQTMCRVWPSEIPIFETENDNEFDQGVVSDVDMGTPVALLHTSRDGLWSFVQTPLFQGWIPSTTVAFGDKETVTAFVNCSPPLVAVGHRVSVYGSPEDRTAVGSIRMGSYLPIRIAGSDFCEVLVPGRGGNGELEAHVGYVRNSSDISIGFLPYTLRNVYRQLFVLYGRRYGWGGMYEERDCSQYVLDVFRCFNIHLPRNSASQANASKVVISFEGMSRETRLKTITAWPGGISLLRLQGHIMIYLGNVDGRPYVIHSFWAWRTPSEGGEDVVHRAARIAVTCLTLGDGSKKGPLIDRLTHMTVLGNFEIAQGQ